MKVIEKSFLERLASLPKENREELLASLSEDEIEVLLTAYKYKARPKQQFPIGDWATWLILSGRGFGKSFVGANWVIHKAQSQKYPIALIGQSAADVRDYMVEVGESSILKQSPDWFKPVYMPSKRRLVFPNGVTCITYSADNPDQLRGFNGNCAWIDELAKFRYSQETWDNLQFALRIGASPQVLITTTPRPIKLLKDLVADNKVIKTWGSTLENKTNLSPSFIRSIYEKYNGTRLGRQELFGEILEDTPGALWNYYMLDNNRCRITFEEMESIVIAIDPATTTTENSNETGIIVVGKQGDKGYILEDLSDKYSPGEWAKRVIDAFEKYKANMIIAETNNGGDLVESNLQLVAKLEKRTSLPFKKVHATRGKFLRAEPIVTLYEKGQISHVGSFPELEEQMVTWTPGNKSPDRLDALVWGLTYLFINQPETNVSESHFW